jgi:peptide/nickel transport system substrate-binding protein
LVIATSDEVTIVDPLFAASRAERLVSRQIHEPLVSVQRGPFDVSRLEPGLARKISPNRDLTVWTIALRRGVRFQNGEPLDAEAVLLNVDRWRRVPRASRLLEGLQAADTPRPGLVRLIFEEPFPGVQEALAHPRLGLVAPAALRAAGTGEVRSGPYGCGPFEYRGRDEGSHVLARSSNWWGARIGLGPGIDQVELQWVPGAEDRLSGLLAGTFDVADRLRRGVRGAIAANPLLAAVGSGGRVMGVARSVRGIDSAVASQSLSDVWLTELR